MTINLFTLVDGLFYKRLVQLIDQGVRLPTLINIAIMSETGSTISLDAMAQAKNDLVIGAAFLELIESDNSGRTSSFGYTD